MEVGKLKLTEILTCQEDASIVEVARILMKNRQRHLIVLKSKKPVGIISITDINNRVVAAGKDIKKTTAKEAMTHSLAIFDSKEDVCTVYLEMIKRGLYSCPVTSKGELSGIIELKEIASHVTSCNIKDGKK